MLFNEQETLATLQDPDNGLTLIEEEVAIAIHYLTGGQPYLLRCIISELQQEIANRRLLPVKICHLSWLEINRLPCQRKFLSVDRNCISIKDLAKITSGNRFYKQYEPYFQKLWSDLQEYQAILSGLAVDFRGKQIENVAETANLSLAECDRHIAYLLHKGAIAAAPRGWRVNSDLLRRWITRLPEDEEGKDGWDYWYFCYPGFPGVQETRYWSWETLCIRSLAISAAGSVRKANFTCSH